MKIYGFTAARDLSVFGHGYIESVLEKLPPADGYVTGGAVGGDALIGQWLYRKYTGSRKHTVVVPYHRSQVYEWWHHGKLVYPGIEVIEMTFADSSYRARNKKIVDICTELVAFPAYPESDPRSQRSGTWMTVRLARQAGKPIIMGS